MATIANIRPTEGGHWYTRTGEASHTVIGKTTGKPRPTTLADAKKLNLLPSTTTVLKALHKEALVRWRVEQAILVAMTTPRLTVEGVIETDDAYVTRVFDTERQHEQEGKKAADLGTSIHAAIEKAMAGEKWDEALAVYVEPVLKLCRDKFGEPEAAEKVVVGEGYAGKLDVKFPDAIVDFKTTKSVPKASYFDHQMQNASYAKAFGFTGEHRIRTANVYIDTKTPGLVTVSIQDDWQEAWKAFEHVLAYWRIANNFPFTL